jgi:rubredoxin-NAD+ reductase
MGPGLIGCEFANDLASQDIEVDVFGPDPWPISTLLPEAAGRALQEALSAAGIRFHLGATAERIDRADGGYRLTLKTGTALQADLVLSAVGLRPDTALARAAGLEVNRGIVTDRLLHTSDPQVYALGDCAEVAGLNLPFVMPIMHAARALAKTLAGEPTEVAYPPMPVVIKTPALATVVAPPPRGGAGDWRVTGSASDIRAIFESAEGELLGFALTGAAAAEKQALTKLLPPVL